MQHLDLRLFIVDITYRWIKYIYKLVFIPKKNRWKTSQIITNSNNCTISLHFERLIIEFE